MKLQEILDARKALIPDYNDTKNIVLQKQDTLRWLVGLLGMLLPFFLWLFLFFHSGTLKPLDSISHYFYTRVGSVFIIIVSLLAIFLLVYKGYELIDYLLSSAAGICALLLLYFPTNNIIGDCNCVITVLDDNEIRKFFHLAMAGIFLGCLTLMSIFLFTKKENDKKGLRMPSFGGENNIFIICGVLMILSMLMIFTNCFGLFTLDEFNQLNLTFWGEVVALEAFGFAWFVKGNVFKSTK
jgi:hypothetical protein